MIPRDDRFDRGRRGAMRGGLALLAGAAAALSCRGAAAAAKIAKTAARYQFTPKADQHCGACASFIPGADPGASGTCKIVDGEIPPNGWCVFFSRKA